MIEKVNEAAKEQKKIKKYNIKKVATIFSDPTVQRYIFIVESRILFPPFFTILLSY